MAVSRQIGPIGTAARALAGLAAIAYPIAAFGISPWDITAALIVFPALAVLLYLVASHAYERTLAGRGSSPTARIWTVSVAVLALVLMIGTGLTFVSPIDGGSIFLFFGASLLVVAVRGDAGCEVLALPNALTGRRESTGCIAFAPVDTAEARLVARSP
jgi:hypothetical protein